MPLFAKKKKDNQSQDSKTVLSQNETSYFGKNLMIKGRVAGNGNVIIMGGLEGEFDLRGHVKIAQPAKIKGEVKADVISVDGHVEGKLAAKQRLHLDQTARIDGQMITPKLSITEGASLNGEVTMSGRVAKASATAAQDTKPAPQAESSAEARQK